MNLQKEILKYVKGDSKVSFDQLAMDVFNFQKENCKTYSDFLKLVGKYNFIPGSVNDIPLLPISAFKHNVVKTGYWSEETVFKSSGTQNQKYRSTHYIKDVDFYHSIATVTFQQNFDLKNSIIIGLLPSYIENQESSLVHMVDHFKTLSLPTNTHYYLNNFKELYDKLIEFKIQNKKVILFGVTFALVDFAEEFKIEYCGLSIVFTGGMKNRKREMSYRSVYAHLKNAFGKSRVTSEYGMTELMSQAYSEGSQGLYTPAKSLRILSKEFNDPFKNTINGKPGQLGVVDLGNLHTCSFILSDDIAVCHNDNGFEIKGRINHSDLRGCTLLYQN